MMVGHLIRRWEMHSNFSDMKNIVGLNFASAIMGAASSESYTAASGPILRKYEVAVAKQKHQLLYFPVHLPDHGHWIVFRIDFGRKEFAYGTSCATYV